MSTVEVYAQLIHKIDLVRNRWRWSQLAEGGLLVITGGLVSLAIVVAADNLLQWGILGRSVLAACLWGGLTMLVMGLLARRWQEDRRDEYFAALIERQHPELGDRLFNALQLGRGQDYGSPQIVGQIVSDASQATIDLEMEDCLDWTPVRRAGVATGIATLALCVYAFVFAPRFSNGLGRVLFPISDIQPYTSTIIDEDSIRPKDHTRFPEGTPITITVSVGGDVLPASARLARRQADGAWRESPMQPAQKFSATDQSRKFQFQIDETTSSFQFYVTAGDDRSHTRQIEIVHRPAVDTISIEYTAPAYAQGAALTSSPTSTLGEISGLAGTRIDWHCTSTKPLSTATLETETGDILTLSPGKDARHWTTSFVLWTNKQEAPGNLNGRLLMGPTRYKVNLLDQDGYENTVPLWRAINLTQDQVPRVAIPTPGQDQQVRIEDTVNLVIEARDDIGVVDLRLLMRINEQETVQELFQYPATSGAPSGFRREPFSWKLSETSLKPGDIVQYWAAAKDGNVLTGPGQASSRRYSLYVITPQQVIAKMEMAIDDYAAVLEELIRLQRENRAQSASGVDFESLLLRQTRIRTSTAVLSRAMKKGALPVATMVTALEELYAGLMADAIRLLETGRDTQNAARAASVRTESIPVQDEIVERLEELLRRLQRNEQARKSLRRIRKKDEADHKELTQALSQLINDLQRLAVDEAEMLSKLEKMPKKPVDELNEEHLGNLKAFEEFQNRWSKWRKGTVDGLSKLPTGFIEDFGLRPDVNRVFEEIEAVARRSKSSKLEVALEDAGTSKATEMLEDLETWMADSSDSLQWIMEEPLDNRPLDMPEMPLPDALEDLIGELLAEADDFDQEADDITSAWGDNLNQAGWGVSDGPISNFSAKGKTGNDLPNANELNGRAGDGRRGKSSGQMVGDTARGLDGRKTPARLNNERYEQGKLKEEGRLDPNGATGGGKKAGSGRRGLQGGTPPDFVRDMERLEAKQAAMREKAQQVARQLDTDGVMGTRLNQAIQLMQTVEGDLRDLRYEDAARKRKIAMQQLKSAFGTLDRSQPYQISQAKDLPAQLRQELLQSAEEGYPEGYEDLLRNYFKKLAASED